MCFLTLHSLPLYHLLLSTVQQWGVTGNDLGGKDVTVSLPISFQDKLLFVIAGFPKVVPNLVGMYAVAYGNKTTVAADSSYSEYYGNYRILAIGR